MWSLSQAISVKVYTMQDYFPVEGEREGACEGGEQTLKTEDSKRKLSRVKQMEILIRYKNIFYG